MNSLSDSCGRADLGLGFDPGRWVGRVEDGVPLPALFAPVRPGDWRPAGFEDGW